ncbi:nucleolin 1-like isoform X3 [Brassica napus]|uniref:nucleolin 1 isoform X3 n=1 Tax=Brassica napus TaxID=3708 RepID=UPI000BBE726E|nr:nucleolin 1 isoform X3 [Brassica napus]XP_048627371.1 nucleolin 1-like isoform X3 [Brassica napus]
MGKKSATKVEAAPAAIKATKPLKKGKRDPEDDLDTKVNLKKQKKDVIAAVQKEKAEKKVPKKVESSDSSDSSDIEEEVKEPAPKKAVASTNGTVAKDDSSSEDDSSDESDDESEKPAAKKAAPATTKAASSADSSEEDSDEKPAAKKAAPATTKAASSADSSEEDSDEESEDEKPAPKKDSSSDDSDSDESESEDEKETPKKKNSDAEMVDAEQKQLKTPSTPATGGSKTLFVANLSFNVERSDVENFFKDVGDVVDVRFAMSKDDGRFRGFGHVEFATAEQAQKALELHGTSMLGRDIRLDVAQERGERPAYTPQSGAGGNFRSSGGGGQSIFVKGFDSSLPEEDIKSALSAHFASCGDITRVSVPCDRETGASKGIAYLDFKDGTDKAFELNGSDMGGWSIVVDQPREKSSGGFGGGGRSGGGRFGSGRSGGGRGRDSGRGRFGGGRGGGRGRDGGRGFNRPSFSGKKTTFNDE